MYRRIHLMAVLVAAIILELRTPAQGELRDPTVLTNTRSQLELYWTWDPEENGTNAFTTRDGFWRVSLSIAENNRDGIGYWLVTWSAQHLVHPEEPPHAADTDPGNRWEPYRNDRREPYGFRNASSGRVIDVRGTVNHPAGGCTDCYTFRFDRSSDPRRTRITLKGCHEAGIPNPSRNSRIHLSMHGSARFPGDAGLPVWFIRADPAGTIVDDFISASLVIDNDSGAPIGPDVLSLIADRSVISPKLSSKDVTSLFRLTSNPKVSLASLNPYTWPPGRTVLEARIPASISAKFLSAMPVNMPFTVRSTALGTPNSWMEAEDALGMRRHRGHIDDGSAEAACLVRSPSIAGDVIAQRFSASRLFPAPGGNPVPIVHLTGIQLGCTSNGGGDGFSAGFDAVELRRADAVFPDSPDLSPQGLLACIGAVGDGWVDVPIPVDPSGAVGLVTLPFGSGVPIANSMDVWVSVYLFPGDTTQAGSSLGADIDVETILGESYFSPSDGQPYINDDASNNVVRLLFSVGP